MVKGPMPAAHQSQPAPDAVATFPAPAGGVFIGSVHYFPARVYFEDTDVSGMVYHANYLRYMERARSDMLRVAGIDQRGNFEGGEGVYAVADLSIAYRRPARLDDDLVVKSKVTAVGAATCIIHQSVMRDEEILTEGAVTVAFLSPQGRPKRQPRPWITLFTRLSQGEDFHS
jgi:acyl-CoA thioester hydrolase